MPYTLRLRPAAVRDLKALPLGIKARIEKAIDSLQANPHPSGSRKLIGFENEWRLRVGNYRVLYVIDDSTHSVVVARIAHRREAYR